MFGQKTATLLEVYVPVNVTLGAGTIQFITNTGETTTSPQITFSGVDPVTDPALVFFDFDANDASIGWSDLGAIENDPAFTLNGKYYHVNATIADGWKTYFERNWGHYATTGVDVNTYAVKMDINIPDAIGTGLVLKFRLSSSTLGDFWYVWKIGEKFPTGTDGWVTVTFPLTEFLDHDGNGPGTISDMSLIGSEYGLTAGWGSGNLNLYIDNIRYQLK